MNKMKDKIGGIAWQLVCWAAGMSRDQIFESIHDEWENTKAQRAMNTFYDKALLQRAKPNLIFKTSARQNEIYTRMGRGEKFVVGVRRKVLRGYINFRRYKDGKVTKAK